MPFFLVIVIVIVNYPTLPLTTSGPETTRTQFDDRGPHAANTFGRDYICACRKRNDGVDCTDEISYLVSIAVRGFGMAGVLSFTRATLC